MSDKTFQEKALAQVERAVLKELSEGRWIKAKYGDIEVDSTFLKNLYDNIDMDKVLQIATEKLEQKIADKILSNMAQEIATDLNRILSDTELREEIRFYLRRKITEKVESLS